MTIEADVETLERAVAIMSAERETYMEIVKDTQAPMFTRLVDDYDTTLRTLEGASRNLRSLARYNAYRQRRR